MRLLRSPAFFFVQPVLLALLSFFLYNVLDHWSLGSPLEIPSFGCPTHQSVLGITLAFYVSILFFSFFLGDFLSFYGVFVVLCLASFLFWLALLWSMEVFFWGGGEVHIYLGSVLRLLPQHTVSASLTIDLISFSFLFLTITIAVWVNVFAFSYFRYEPNVDRLLLLLNAFILSMGVLVIAGNLVVLFFGWEMIGLTSFLLINFWQTRVGTLKSAFKAYSFNKFSDSSLLLGLVYFYFILGDLDFRSMSLSLPPIAPVWSSGLCLVSPAEVAAFLFVCAASVKSAQAGFHVWLPDSMEAPVPASALIHSATLVSAGIFLLVRLQCLIELTWFVSSFVILIGAVTAFVGGFSALFQTDLKRILAYSTVSHCGFLFFLAVSGTLEHTLFYLYVHGFFKASSFLCVGSILRYTHGQQDVRRMGSLWKYLPAEFYFLLFCLSCLSGMPMFFGYSVKHLALGSSVPSIFGLVAGSVVLLAALAGLFYSHKILFFVFFDSKKGRKSAYLSAAGADLMSVYYSNTTLASNISIGALAGSAYFVSYLAASALSADSGLTLLGGASTFGYDLVAASAEVDVSLHFNFRLLNTLVCILFFFLNFFCWSRTSNLGYSLLCTLALAIVLS